MKSFDLMFNGGILPDHDPGQVRRELSRLLEIDDSALLERIFSGQTIVLRHNLDRKAAADFFRKITLIGGQASLVKSPKYRSVQGDELLVLESAGQGDPAPQPIPVPQAIPVPEPNPVPDPEPIPLPADMPPELPPEPPLEPVIDRQTLDNMEKSRVEALGRARQSSEKKEAGLLRQREQHNRIALEEIERIERLREDKLADLEQEIAGLLALRDAQAETLAARLSDIEKKKAESEERTRRSVARLDELMATAKQDDAELADLLSQRLAATRESSLEAIRRLEQQIEDTRLRAEAEMADLEQQREDMQARSEAALEALKDQRADTLRDRDAEIDGLEREFRAARELSESRNAELTQQEQQLREREDEEARKLDAMKHDIESRRDAGLAGVERELAQIRKKTRDILRQLGETDSSNDQDYESPLRHSV